MPLQYGLNITKSDMQKMLEQNDKQQNGIRTWRSLFGNAGLGAQAQSDAITSSYTDAIAQAYKANFEQQNAMYSSGLGAGAVKEALAMSRQELQNTYNNYMANYASDINNAQSAYNEEVGTIAGALGERAQNFTDLYNSAYTYLSEELFGASREYENWNEATGTEVVTGEGKDPTKEIIYTPKIETEDYLTEHGLDWLKDEEGNLRSWNDLSKDILNEDGTFTDKGVLFFDQMFNARPEDFERTDEDGNILHPRGFDEWLSETNAELRDWWASYDAYNYTFAGSNAGSTKAYAGIDSTDMSAEQLAPKPGVGDGSIKSTTDKPLFIRQNINAEAMKPISEGLTSAVSRMQQLTDEYNSRRTSGGLTADYERQWRTEYGKLQSEVYNYDKQIKNSYKQILNSTLNSFKADVNSVIYDDLITQFGQEIDKLNSLLSSYTFNTTGDYTELANRYDKLMSEIENWITNYQRRLPDSQKPSGF